MRFMKSSTPRPDEKRAAARRRQHVVGARDVVADHLRRMRAEEDRAGIADAVGELLRLARRDLQMLGRDAVGKRRRLVERAQLDDGAEHVPASPAMLPRGSAAELARDRRFDRARESAHRPSSGSTGRRVSCSACASRSAAIHSGSLCLSAMIRTSDGPAMLSMPTVPNTWRLAAAT